MKFIYHAANYNAKSCCLSVDEIERLHERLDAASAGSLVPCSEKEMQFLHECEPYQEFGQHGDLRDEFAKAALVGLLTRENLVGGDIVALMPAVAVWAYGAADAMMEERSRRDEVHV